MPRLLPLLLVAVVGPTAIAHAAVTTHGVDVHDNEYRPTELTIDLGDSVRWTNVGLTQHSVTFRSGTSVDLLPRATTTRRFDNPGTYLYFCRFHEDQMQGTVIVRGTTGTTARPTTTTTEPPEGSARTGSPDTSTTSTSTTTTTLLDGDTTTTTAPADSPSGQASGPLDSDGGNGTDIDGPAAVAALLLLATAGGAFLLTRTHLP